VKIFEQISLQLKRAAKPHQARMTAAIVYVFGLIVLFLLLTLVRAICFGLDHYWESLLDKLSAALIIAMIGVVLALMLSPRISYEENLAVLDSWQIKEKLVDALARTRTYYFRGRSGRWVRTTAFPALFEQATRESLLRSIRLILPDPDDTSVMQTYAEYRNSLSDAKKDPWTAARIRNEILATILEAGRLASQSTFFEAHVALTSDFSLFRADLSDLGLVLSREDPRYPGWFSHSGTKFYASYLEDLRLVERRGRIVDFGGYAYPAKFGVADVRPALIALKFTTTLGPSDCQAVLNAMRSRKDPYA